MNEQAPPPYSPPPYSPHPNRTYTPTTDSPPDSPSTIQPSAPSLRGGYLRVVDDDEDVPFSSAAAYFEERPFTLQFPTTTIVVNYRISASTSRDDFKLPDRWQEWQARDVSEQDWATFVNYVLEELGNSARTGDDKQREPMSAAEEFDICQTRAAAVFTEWNESFFNPRKIHVIPIVSFENPTIMRSTSPSPSYRTVCELPVPTGSTQLPFVPRESFPHPSNMLTGHVPHTNATDFARSTGPQPGGRMPPWGPHFLAPYQSRLFQQPQFPSVYSQDNTMIPQQPFLPYGHPSKLFSLPEENLHPGRHGRHGKYGGHHRCRGRGRDDSDSHGRHRNHSRSSSSSSSEDSDHRGKHGSHARGRGRRGGRHNHRRSESTSSSSSSSSSSDSTISSLSSEDFQSADMASIRQTLATFRLDPTKKAHVHTALRQLKAEIRAQHKADRRDRGEQTRESRSEWRSRRKEVKTGVKSLLKEAKQFKKSEKRARKEEKRARKAEQKFRKSANDPSAPVHDSNRGPNFSYDSVPGAWGCEDPGVRTLSGFHAPLTSRDVNNNGQTFGVTEIPEPKNVSTAHLPDPEKPDNKFADEHGRYRVQQPQIPPPPQVSRRVHHHQPTCHPNFMRSRTGGAFPGVWPNTSTSTITSTSTMNSHAENSNPRATRRVSATRPGDLGVAGRVPSGQGMGQGWESFGREIGQWGEQFGRNMERWGEKFGRDMEERGRRRR